MRKLNVKKLAAIGVGAALIGGAMLAPVSSALNSNLSGLTKSDIVDSTGSPVVDIVAGSGAAPSDWAWAGNIAAKVAQLATTSKSVQVVGGTEGGTTTAEPTGLSVDFTKGGSKTYSTETSKNYNTIALQSGTGAGPEFSVILTSSQLSFLENDTYNYKVAGSNYTQTIKETIGIAGNPRMNYINVSQIGDPVLEMTNSNDFNYTLTFGKGIPITDTTTSIYSATAFTDGTNDNVPIPWFGENYTLFQADFTGTPYKMKLIKEQEKLTYYAGQEVTGLKGKNLYAGQEMSIKFVGIGSSGPGGTAWTADLELYDEEGNLVTTQYDVAGGTFLDTVFNDENGDPALDTIVYLDSVRDQDGVGRLGLTIGSSLLEIANDKAYPYDSTDTDSSDDYWAVAFGAIADSTSPDINVVTTITVKNNVKVWKNNVDYPPVYSPDFALTEKGKADDGQAIFLEGYENSEDIAGYDFVRVAFDGFDDAGKNYTTIKIGQAGENTGYLSNGYIEYTDTGDFMHRIPFYMDLGFTTAQKSFELDKQTFYYWCDDTAATFDVNTVAAGRNTCSVADSYCSESVNGARIITDVGGSGHAAGGGATDAGVVEITWPSEAPMNSGVDGFAPTNAINLGGMNFTINDINGVTRGLNPATAADDNAILIDFDFNCQWANVGFTTASDADFMDTNNWHDTFYLRQYDTNKENETWWGNPLTLTGAGTNEQSFQYDIYGSEDRGELYLLLDNTTQFNVLYNKEVVFGGTDTGEDGFVASWDANALQHVTSADVNYYKPDASIDAEWGTNDKTYNVAHFFLDTNVENAGSRWLGGNTGVNIRDFNVYIYVPTGGSIDGGQDTLDVYAPTAEQAGTTMTLEYDPANQAQKLLAAYADFGTKIVLDKDYVSFKIPENALNLDLTVLGKGTSTTIEGGETATGIEEGDSFEFSDGIEVTVDSINYTAGTCDVTGGATASPSTYMSINPVDKLVYSDVAAPSGGKIIVGGFLVNSLARNFVLSDGTTLEDALQSSGDAVAQIVDGDIIAAGFTAGDTGTAAEALIDALEGLLG